MYLFAGLEWWEHTVLPPDRSDVMASVERKESKALVFHNDHCKVREMLVIIKNEAAL